MSTSTPSRAFPWKPALGAILLVALIIGGRLFPIAEWLTAFNAWVAGLGPWGFVVFVVAYIIATVFFLPGSVLTLGAGFIFGVATGTATVSLGSTLGAAAAFLISRYAARDAVKNRLGTSATFQAVDRAIEREGARIVLLTRLSPIFPFNALNYLLGLTSVRFWPYVGASWLGMLPGTVLYVYLGYAGRTGLEVAAGSHSGGGLRTAYMVGGLLATLAVTVYVTKLARKELHKAASSKEAEGRGVSD